MQAAICSIAIFLFALVSPEKTARFYVGLDSKDSERAEFALEMIQQTLSDPRLVEERPAARLFVNGDAVELLRAGASPIEAGVLGLVRSKADFKIIGCGRSAAAMRSSVNQKKIKLISGAELRDDCRSELQSLRRGGFYSVEIPALD